MSDSRIEKAILAACQERGPESSVCPSEVARALDPENWRPLMEPVRAVAAKLAQSGRIRITQRGVEVDPERIRGAIRLQWVGRDG